MFASSLSIDELFTVNKPTHDALSLRMAICTPSKDKAGVNMAVKKTQIKNNILHASRLLSKIAIFHKSHHIRYNNHSTLELLKSYLLIRFSHEISSS
jgi:hypothetical protein